MKKGSWSANFVPPGLTRSISTREASPNAKVHAYLQAWTETDWISCPVARGERFLCLSLGLVKAPASEDKLTADNQTHLFNQSFMWHRRREDTAKLGNVCVMLCWMMGLLMVSYASFQLSVSKAPTLPVGSRPVSRVRWVLINQNSDPGAASDAQKPPQLSKEEL